MSMSYDDWNNAQSAFTAAGNSKDKELASRLKAQYLAIYASDEKALDELKDIIYKKTPWDFYSL